MVDLIEPSEILVDPIELMELCPVERPKVDLNDSTRSSLTPKMGSISTRSSRLESVFSFFFACKLFVSFKLLGDLMTDRFMLTADNYELMKPM